MSLSSSIADAFARVGTEFKSVRTAIAATNASIVATNNVFVQTSEPTPASGFGPFIWFQLDSNGVVIDIRKGAT